MRGIMSEQNQELPYSKHMNDWGLKTGRIIVVDDDQEMRSLLNDLLNSRGYDVIGCASANEALESLHKREVNALAESREMDVDLVISDLNMPGMNGLEFIEKFRSLYPQIPFILITAFGSIETAVQAIRKGAFDYITKPFKLSEISVHVDRAIEFRGLQKENNALRREMNQNQVFAQMVGKSSGMQEVFDLIKRVSQANANILIQGESGTGKERVARAIHDLGPRSSKAFVAINCTSIPENLLESELFGSVENINGQLIRKPGLFVEAQGGSIFLDEIGDMNLALQAKLLRCIQEKKIRAVGDTQDVNIDVRVIAATHKDLKSSIKNASFREDLYYRLSVIPILIPPLRHRREDIPLLAEHFLMKYRISNHSKVRGFTKEAMSKLMGYHWEGNVRELENVIERAVVLAPSELITEKDLPQVEQSTADTFFSQAVNHLPTLEDLERRYMKFVLDKIGGRKEKAAQILGINRRTLYRKEREYGFVNESSDSIHGGVDEVLKADTHAESDSVQINHSI